MRPGDVVLVKFPFSDLESSKKRPALVLARSDLTAKVGLITIAMITSKVEGLKFPNDHKVEDWKSAGLLHPSLVRISKIATVELDLVLKAIGRLNATDLKGIKSSFQKHFKAWV